MNRTVLSLLLSLVVGCSDVGGYVEANDGSPKDAKAPKVYTICADPVAGELDPELDTLIADALLYWQGEPGAERLEHTPGAECDVAVRFADESEYEPGSNSLARATVVGGWKPGCSPKRMVIRESRWARLKAKGRDFAIVAHEVGHLVCLPHTKLGIMAPNANI